MSADGQSVMRSVERAIDVLSVLERHVHPMRLTDVASSANLAASTTQRLLATLEKRGLVERRDARYQLGVGIVPLAHAYLMGNRLSSAALPVLQELAAATGLTASLFVRLGFHRVVAARVQGEHPLRYVLPIGDRLPLHLGGGRVLAAGMSAAEVDELLGQTGEIRLKTGARLTHDEFREALERIRRDGYHISQSERVADVTSVSAPVTGAEAGTVGVVVVSGTSHDLGEDRIPSLITEVRLAAQAISLRNQTA